MTIGYLKKILTASVCDVAIESPLAFSPSLSERTGNRICYTREDMQSVFSFKLRGAAGIRSAHAAGCATR